MLEDDIVFQGAEERNPAADEHWNARDNQTLNEPGPEKSLNGAEAGGGSAERRGPIVTDVEPVP